MNNVNDYWILRAIEGGLSGVIDDWPNDYPPDYKLHLSKSMRDQFPEIAELSFDETMPDHTKLYDFVDNTMSLLIVSSRVKAVFDGLNISTVEYIPALIKDQQGTLLANDYYIINTLDEQPVIDMKRTKCVMSSLQTMMILNFRKLHIDAEAVDPDAKLFRATNEDSIYFITNEVLEAMKAADITGICVIKAEGWDGLSLNLC